MCEQCERQAERDRAMWEAVRLGLIGVQRGLGAVVKAIERYQLSNERKVA